MPGFYRKKRRKAGPNKNQEKVQRGREAEAEAHAAGRAAPRVPPLRRAQGESTPTPPHPLPPRRRPRRDGRPDRAERRLPDRRRLPGTLRLRLLRLRRAGRAVPDE